MQEQFVAWIQFYDLQFKKERGSEVSCRILPYKLQRPHFIPSHSSVTAVLSMAAKECNRDLNNLDQTGLFMSPNCCSNRGCSAHYHGCIQTALLNQGTGDAQLHTWSGPYAHLMKCSIMTKSRFWGFLFIYFLHDCIKTQSHNTWTQKSLYFNIFFQR